MPFTVAMTGNGRAGSTKRQGPCSLQERGAGLGMSLCILADGRGEKHENPWLMKPYDAVETGP